MTTILERIVETKRKELIATKQHESLEQLRRRIERSDAPRDFFGAVTATSPRGVQLIAEIKRASPSAGQIVADFDPVSIARKYHSCRAAALSVLTDEAYFQGRLSFIRSVKQAVPLPVLRKDFIIDEYQVYESRAAQADAVLLIFEVLGAEGIVPLAEIASSLSMTSLVEVHTEDALRAVLSALGPPGRSRYLLGINNRDLAAQQTDVSTTARLAAALPGGSPFVSESGIASRDDVLEVQRAGACAILVGESLLRSGDIGVKIDALLGR